MDAGSWLLLSIRVMYGHRLLAAPVHTRHVWTRAPRCVGAEGSPDQRARSVRRRSLRSPPNSGLLRFAADAALADARSAQLKPGTLGSDGRLGFPPWNLRGVITQVRTEAWSNGFRLSATASA